MSFPPPADVSPEPRPPQRVLRFHRSERSVHWSIAIPFLVCWVTAVVLVFGYNPAPDRPLRMLFAWTHRISGICFAILPLLAILRATGDLRLHFENIRQAWVWTLQDIRWMALLGVAAVSRRVELPEQGKFNAAEKLNFMVLMAFYPLYVVTGITIWLTDGAFVSWILHFFMALVGTPLVLGHIFMATLNPSSRVGLSGMISGYVDRQWAKHHYRRWYREHHEEGNADTPPEPAPEPTPDPASDPAREGNAPENHPAGEGAQPPRSTGSAAAR